MKIKVTITGYFDVNNAWYKPDSDILDIEKSNFEDDPHFLIDKLCNVSAKFEEDIT